MPFPHPYQSLGAGLTCVAVLAGAAGFGLGWFPHTAPRQATTPPITVLTMPVLVEVSDLRAARLWVR